MPPLSREARDTSSEILPLFPKRPKDFAIFLTSRV